MPDRRARQLIDADMEPARPAIPVGLIAGGVVAIGRRVGFDRVGSIVDGLREGGVEAFELTLNDPEADALRSIEAAARLAAGTTMTIGAGTVLSIDAARRALEAGATFLVMPHTDAELVAWAAANGTPAIPGASTPTEAYTGWRAGAAAIKLFPASVLGPSFLREIRGPFPDLPIIPSGGVTPETAGDYIRAGAVAVGLGSWLIGDGATRGVTERARRVVLAVAEARAPTAS
jgi:2-dehydro-3-deoxyphosphogluconate aldolase / (4S)-4-hydroxy-2-oxoglutarate aldolase